MSVEVIQAEGIERGSEKHMSPCAILVVVIGLIGQELQDTQRMGNDGRHVRAVHDQGFRSS